MSVNTVTALPNPAPSLASATTGGVAYMRSLHCQSFNIVKDGTRITKWLYHVTRPKYLPSILREGLRPRKGRKAKRPEYESCPLLVYFKREIGSCRDGHPCKPCDCVLLVVNQDALVRELFRPDEDRLFDRGNYSCICGAVKPGQYYDDFIKWKNHAEDCLITNIEARANAFTDDDITVAYKGTVPPDAIVATGPLVTSHEWAATAETIKANKPLVHRLWAIALCWAKNISVRVRPHSWLRHTT